MHTHVRHTSNIQTMMWYSIRTHFCKLCLQGRGVGCPASRHEAEVRVVASCPEDHHDRVMAICKGLGMFKAFGKKGDFIDQLNSGAQWFDLWKAKVCQTVLVATMHSECSVVRILCIEGGPNCDEEYKSIPDLKKAVKDDMKKQNGREVEVECTWMSMELFETQFGTLASQFAITFGFSLMWCSTCGCQLYVPRFYAI